MLVILGAIAVGLYLLDQVLPLVGFLHAPTGDVLTWVGGALVMAVVGTLVYRQLTGRSLWGLRRWRWSDLAWGALAGSLVVFVDLVVLGPLFEALVPFGDGPPVLHAVEHGLVVAPVLVATGVALVGPVGEEVLFRGLLLRGLDGALQRWLAVAIVSLLFGLAHLDWFAAGRPDAWLAVVSAAIAGVVFAAVLLHTGHLLSAVTAHVVVNAVYVTVGLVVGISAVWTVGPAGDVPAVDLPVGACADARWWEGEPVDASTQVDCDVPHRVEVAAREPLELPRTFPDDAGPHDRHVGELADAVCLERFDTYVGAAWEHSELDVVALLPDEDRWAAGDRDLICLVIPFSEPDLIGSARGSGR